MADKVVFNQRKTRYKLSNCYITNFEHKLKTIKQYYYTNIKIKV